ncbi:MAG: tyrosine-type recombinase/integrase, partial [Lachnospiraceae bacterium]|nr:tyrosine-type recombinase/integrase [Lachnospiraceae bacterium]
YEVLKELYEEQQKYGVSPLVVDGATGFVFINKVGTLHKHSAIDHAIKRIVNNYNAEEVVKAKKEEREPVILPFFSCHTFRHTFCTRFCENETNVKVIQSVMGHADIQTTMDVYAEVTERKKKESMDNLSKNMNIFRKES